jgi:hypothetical protein
MDCEIPLMNSPLVARVEEGDYELVKSRKWFLDGRHVYTKVMVPIDDSQSRHKSYPLKIRMDRYIYHLTTHNFVHIRHWADDVLNNCRSAMQKVENARAVRTRGMTRWLGVKSVKGYIVAQYRNRAGILVRDEYYKLSRSADLTTRLNTQTLAARQYDKWAIEEEGPRAKTNFLPESIYVPSPRIILLHENEDENEAIQA